MEAMDLLGKCHDDGDEVPSNDRRDVGAEYSNPCILLRTVLITLAAYRRETDVPISVYSALG